MAQPTDNARRLLGLFEQMRGTKMTGAARQLADLNLSFSHLRALHALAHSQQIPMKELAETLDLTPPSVTALTRRLVQTGLVQRAADQNDNRISLLSLTEEGRTLLGEVYQSQLQHMEALLHGLSAEEQQQFLHLLERAVQALRADNQQIGG